MHRTARFAVWMSMVVTVVAAFQVFLAVDEAQPSGTRSAFVVERVDTATKAEALDLIAVVARDIGCTIDKVQPDPDDTAQARVLYAFVGDPQQFADRGGRDYPTFDAEVLTTRVLLADDITTEDLRGRYVTDLSAGDIDDLLERLTAGGLVVRDDTTPALGLLLYGVAQGNLAGAMVMTVLALAVAILSTMAQERKVPVLLALHGFGRARIFLRTVTAVTRTFGVGAVVLLIVGAPVLGIVNRFAQAMRFGRVVALALVTLYLIVIALVAVSALVLGRADPRAVIQGDRASWRVAGVAAVVQVVALAILIATTAAGMTRISRVADNLAVAEAWAAEGPLYALRLSVTGTHEDDMATAPALATVIADLEARGQVVLVRHQDAEDAGYTDGGSTADYGPEESASVIVNDEYLRRQSVRDEQGSRIVVESPSANAFTVIVPASYPGDADDLAARYTDYFEEMCTLGRPTGTVGCDPVGRVVRSASPQSDFLYNGTEYLPVDQQDRSFLRDPVLVVVSAESGLIAPFEYLSAVSMDDVLFTDPDDLRAALDAAGIAEAFQGIDNAADAVATSEMIARRQLRMDAVSLGIGGAVLLISSVVMATVYCDRQTRAMFVQLLHGARFPERHRNYLGAVIGLSVLGVGIALVGGGIAFRARDGLLALGLIAIQVAVAAVVIAVTENRFRADYIKR